MSNYDRKLEARKEQAAKDKKTKTITAIVAIVIVLAIIGAIVGTKIASSAARRAAEKNTYVKIGSHEVSQVEYDYYFYSTINEYIQMYSSFLQYMGLDTTQPLDQQMYSETMTWKDAFDDMATGRLQAVYAYIDDGKANGFEYDVEADYADYALALEESADDGGFALDDYYVGMYGEFATVKNIAPFIKDTLYANAYMAKLQDDYAPADDKITAYYGEHKEDYDTVDFYAVAVSASEEDGVDYDTAKSNAATIAQKVANGDDFDEAAAEFVPFPEGESTYLSTDMKKAYIATLLQDWLFNDVRVAGDATVIEDTDNNRAYAVEFKTRTYDDQCVDQIKSTLISEAVTAYMEDKFAKYDIVDVKGDLKFLTLEDAE